LFIRASLEAEGVECPAAQQPAAPAAAEPEEDDGNGLAIAALVIAVVGLAAGLAALFVGRRRGRVGVR
jgi:hypothetical protein